MLFVNHKYESLDKLFEYDSIKEDIDNEKLSKDTIKDITNFIKSADLSDDVSPDEYKKSLMNQSTKRTISNDESFIKFCNSHMFDETIQDVLIKFFSDNITSLKYITDNEGIVDLNELLSKNGNIYSYCDEFKKEAEELAKWKPSSDKSGGEFELLLQTIIKGGYRPSGKNSKGDVGVRGAGGIEVKKSGGVVQGIGKAKADHPRVIYSLIDDVFGESIVSKNELGKVHYASRDGIKTFNNRLSLYIGAHQDTWRSDIAKAIVDGVSDQYRQPHESSLYKEAENLINDRMSLNGMWNLIGCIQLYMYHKVESDASKYFAVINSAGDYCIVESDVTLNKFQSVLDKFYFKDISMKDAWHFAATIKIK